MLEFNAYTGNVPMPSFESESFEPSTDEDDKDDKEISSQQGDVPGPSNNNNNKGEEESATDCLETFQA